jgi:hypothetical protein
MPEDKQDAFLSRPVPLSFRLWVIWRMLIAILSPRGGNDFDTFKEHAD